jgi:hypothetical protein
MLVAFGTVDVTYMLFEWDMANKAAVIGARTAVVSNPIAGGIMNVAYTGQLGQSCFNTSNCPVIANVVCTPAASGGSCTGGYTFDDNAFTTILTKMREAFPSVAGNPNQRLQRQNVLISYLPNDLGFVGRPGGLPMDVRVGIRCMTHQLYFLGALMSWVFPALPAGCPAAPAGWTIPTFATTLPSESLSTN